MQLDADGRPVLDDTLRTIVSVLRRRPDGKMASLEARLLWQMAAVTLALYPISVAEFSAMMLRLEQSIRCWMVDSGSRAYTAFLREHVPSVAAFAPGKIGRQWAAGMATGDVQDRAALEGTLAA